MLKFIKKALNAYLRRRSMNRLKDMIVNDHNDISVVRDGVFDARKYGFSLTESQQLCLTKENYKEYISTWESYQPRVKSTPYFCMGDDKYIFSMTFGKFVETPKTYAIIENGEIVSIDADVNMENLYDFLLKNGGGVIKDRCGADGFGIYVFKLCDDKLFHKGKEYSEQEIKKVVKIFKHGIVQNIIKQGEFENEIFNKSVNTIRICSMRKKDSIEHEIVSVLKRMGTERSYPTDNYHQGGAVASVDIETGEMSRITLMEAIDKDGKRIYYDKHPDTGVQITGKKIPNWEKIKEQVIDLTRKLPYFDFIAWDVVLKDDGIAVIEINMKSGLGAIQTFGGLKNSLLGDKFREFGYIKE